jgi:EcsC protein family
MSMATRTQRPKLTSYEAEQVRQIAAWKSEPPNPLSELWKRITMPVASAVERLLPDRAVRVAITKAYDVSETLAAWDDVRRRAGVEDIAELRHRPLEECDRLASSIGSSAEAIAAVEGAATGAGGMLTTLLDVPLLFVLGLSTIRKVGHCYGYPLEHHKDRHFVLGVMIAALAGSLEVRRRRVHQLRELEDLLIEETQEDILTEEALSFLFQLEVFEGVPGIGTISGGALNWLFMRRVEETARMVFGERWLKDNGKVEHIEPAETHARHLAPGWAGTLNRVAYSGCYYMGFGVALPVFAMGSLFRRMDNPVTRGLNDGAAAAAAGADRLVALVQGKAAAPIQTRGAVTPSLAPA